MQCTRAAETSFFLLIWQLRCPELAFAVDEVADLSHRHSHRLLVFSWPPAISRSLTNCFCIQHLHSQSSATSAAVHTRCSPARFSCLLFDSGATHADSCRCWECCPTLQDYRIWSSRRCWLHCQLLQISKTCWLCLPSVSTMRCMDKRRFEHALLFLIAWLLPGCPSRGRSCADCLQGWRPWQDRWMACRPSPGGCLSAV